MSFKTFEPLGPAQVSKELQTRVVFSKGQAFATNTIARPAKSKQRFLGTLARKQ